MSKSMFAFNGTKDQEARLLFEMEKLKGTEGALMPAMQKAQEIYGYLPIEVQKIIAENLSVSLEEVYGVCTFYSQFALTPQGKHKVGVCMGTACYVKNSQEILNAVQKKLGIATGQTTADRKFTLEATRCIGCCGLAPVFTVGEDVYGKVNAADVDKIIDSYNHD